MTTHSPDGKVTDAPERIDAAWHEMLDGRDNEIAALRKNIAAREAEIAALKLGADLASEKDSEIRDLKRAETCHFEEVAELQAGVERLKESNARLTREMLQLIDQRDASEEALSQAYYLTVGHSPEWSNLFGHAEALEEIGDAIHVLKSTLSLAQAEIAELRKALEPFAEEAAFYDDSFDPAEGGDENPEPIADNHVPLIMGEDDNYEASYTVGDLRNARAALAKPREGEG